VDAPRLSVAEKAIAMTPLSTNLTCAKVALLEGVKDPGWMGAGPGPSGSPQLSNAPAHDIPAAPLRGVSANPHQRAVAAKLDMVTGSMAHNAAGGLVARGQPLSDAPPPSSRYGPVAPAWARQHPRMILAWACLRALRWVLRDFWRAFISCLS
jgi:hypothetical protein